MKTVFFYQTSIGKLAIAENGQAVTNLYFDEGAIPHEAIHEETGLLREAGLQLQEYLAGSRQEFDLPLAPEGTVFMQLVWEALLTIPYGETRTYREIAEAIGSPTAARAVGHANSKNPLSLFIPCHRVIGAKGELTGYLGGLDRKQFLLELEKRIVAKGKQGRR